MGILDRLRHFDETEPEPEPEPAPETVERVEAILSVLTAYLDPDSGLSNMLYTIARRELVTADSEKLDVVIVGVLEAADKLRPYAPAGPVPWPVRAAANGAE